jgi:hypothetical protein
MPGKSELTLPEAIFALAEQFRIYNEAHAPVQVAIRSEAEAFRATYDREDPEKRELADFLRGVQPEAESGQRRASAVKDGRGKKKTGRGRGSAK